MLRSKQNILIVALAIALLLGVIAQVVYLHRMSEIEVLSRFQEEHLEHVQKVADQIRFYFQHQLLLMRSLSFLISLPSSDADKTRKDLLDHVNQMRSLYVERISVCDMAGWVRYSTDANILGSNLGQRPFFVWAKEEQNREKVLASPLVEAGERPYGSSRPLRFLIAIPLYQGSLGLGHSESDRKFTGAISLVINLEESLVAQLRIVHPERNSYQLWMMDQNGTLLFQSHHPDMVVRNIFEGDESCNRCHRSFDYAKQILEKKEGTISYQVANLPEKLAAFTSIEWEGQSWRLVMASDYDVMTAFSKRSLEGHLTLLSIFVFVLIAGSVLIHRHDRSRIQAEEEVRHWREKETLENRARESQERYRMLVETMNAGLGVMDEKGGWIYVNDRLCDMVGYSRDEMIGRPVAEFLDREGQQIYVDQMPKRRKGYSEPYETTGVRKDGQRLFARVSPKPIFDDQGAFRGSFAVITDITALKRTEETLRESEEHLQALSFQLLMAQEKERGRISRELHDELGQSLAVLKLRLKFLEKNFEKDPEKVREECEQSFQYIDQMIEEVRRLSRDLSPSMVEDLGLSNALRWLINNFGRNNSLELTLDIKDADIDHLLSQVAQVVIYRILQEALTNIGKHARASHVSVAIDRQDKDLSLLVQDDGKGFDVTEALRSKAPSKGLGLVTMQERAKMLGGTLEVWSQKGKGTRISLHFPLDDKGRL